MPSKALDGLLSGLDEIDAMQRANPSPQEGGGLTKPSVVRALGRAEVVLLSSHFERYLYALNEEAVALILANAVQARSLPEEIRLLHVRAPLEVLAQTSWDRRADKLRDFSQAEAEIWDDDAVIRYIDPERLLTWMKAPNCKAVVRLFKMWGVPDIFTAVTRSKVNRQALWLRIGELVDKRNNIAHGDLTVEARYLDVVQYRASVKKFCMSADKQMAVALVRMLGCPRPW